MTVAETQALSQNHEIPTERRPMTRQDVVGEIRQFRQELANSIHGHQGRLIQAQQTSDNLAGLGSDSDRQLAHARELNAQTQEKINSKLRADKYIDRELLLWQDYVINKESIDARAEELRAEKEKVDAAAETMRNAGVPAEYLIEAQRDAMHMYDEYVRERIPTVFRPMGRTGEHETRALALTQDWERFNNGEQVMRDFPIENQVSEIQEETQNPGLTRRPSAESELPQDTNRQETALPDSNNLLVGDEQQLIDPNGSNGSHQGVDAGLDRNSSDGEMEFQLDDDDIQHGAGAVNTSLGLRDILRNRENWAPAARMAFSEVWRRTPNILKNWVRNLDPRGKDWAWRIGMGAGVVEGVAANLLPIPGGRLVISALNFVGGQMVYGAVRTIQHGEARGAQRDIESAEETVERMERLQQNHELANIRIKNFLLGLSAGLTYTSLGGLALSAAEGAIHAAVPGIDGAAKAGSKFAEQSFRSVQDSASDIQHDVVGQVKRAIDSIQGAEHHTIVPEQTPILVETMADKMNDFLKIEVVVGKGGDHFWDSLDVPGKLLHNGAVEGWTDGFGGNSQEDVLRSIVTQFARANGHELGNLTTGSHVVLGDVLDANGEVARQQMDVIQRVMASSSGSDYAKNVYPIFQRVLELSRRQ